MLQCAIAGPLEQALVDKPSIKVLVISINLDDGNRHTVDINTVRKTTSRDFSHYHRTVHSCQPYSPGSHQSFLDGMDLDPKHMRT